VGKGVSFDVMDDIGREHLSVIYRHLAPLVAMAASTLIRKEHFSILQIIGEHL
jgi:hypothetical protein